MYPSQLFLTAECRYHPDCPPGLLDRFSGFPRFHRQKNPAFLQDRQENNFQDLFEARECLNIKRKTAFTYSIQSAVHCRKFIKNSTLYLSKQQSTQTGFYTIAACSPFEPLENVRLSRIFFQDFPGPKWLSGTFQVLEFSRKKLQDFPGGVGTLVCQIFKLVAIKPRWLGRTGRVTLPLTNICRDKLFRQRFAITPRHHGVTSVSLPSLTTYTHILHCVSKKRHPFYFCDVFVRLHPILLIFGRNIPQEIWNTHIYIF